MPHWPRPNAPAPLRRKRWPRPAPRWKRSRPARANCRRSVTLRPAPSPPRALNWPGWNANIRLCSATVRRARSRPARSMACRSRSMPCARHRAMSGPSRQCWAAMRRLRWDRLRRMRTGVTGRERLHPSRWRTALPHMCPNARRSSPHGWRWSTWPRWTMAARWLRANGSSRWPDASAAGTGSSRAAKVRRKRRGWKRKTALPHWRPNCPPCVRLQPLPKRSKPAYPPRSANCNWPLSRPNALPRPPPMPNAPPCAGSIRPKPPRPGWRPAAPNSPPPGPIWPTSANMQRPSATPHRPAAPPCPTWPVAAPSSPPRRPATMPPAPGCKPPPPRSPRTIRRWPSRANAPPRSAATSRAGRPAPGTPPAACRK